MLEAAIARGRVTDPTGRVDVTLFGLEEPVHLRGDQRQLSSAVGNLVENAVKYSPDGGAVQLRARVDGRHVELMVADQGIGIPQRDLDRIFERFYQTDSGSGRRYEGTGIGLSIVRDILRLHGCSIQVASEPDKGSVFSFTLAPTTSTSIALT